MFWIEPDTGRNSAATLHLLPGELIAKQDRSRRLTEHAGIRLGRRPGRLVVTSGGSEVPRPHHIRNSALPNVS